MGVFAAIGSRWSLLALLGLMSAQAAAYEISGKVVSVADGDTITVLEGKQRHKIRLASIDAPEKGGSSKRPGQPFGDASRKFLSELVAGKTVVLTCYEADNYGRHVCDIPLDQGTANQLMVYAGYAWANRQADDKYLRDSTLLALQADARQNKRGLWAESDPVAPWVWRVKCWREGQCGR